MFNIIQQLKKITKKFTLKMEKASNYAFLINESIENEQILEDRKHIHRTKNWTGRNSLLL